jgi:hypothetical protein
MHPKANIAKRARLHAHLLIITICCALAACTSRADVHEAVSAEAAPAIAIMERAEPRLRRDSVARIPKLRMFGNVAIKSSLDARCGYRDDVTTVLCLNVAGHLNADDADRVREGDTLGMTVRTRDTSAREAVGRVHGDAVAHAEVAALPREAGSCRGACATRIELVRAR